MCFWCFTKKLWLRIFSCMVDLNLNKESCNQLDIIVWNTIAIFRQKKKVYLCQLLTNDAGGTFALYSILCRHAGLSILPNQQAVDEKLSEYVTEGSADTWQSSALKSFFEKHPRFCKGLLIFVLLGTCMAIADGVLTPAISGSWI